MSRVEGVEGCGLSGPCGWFFRSAKEEVMLKRLLLSFLVCLTFVGPAVAQTAPDLQSAVALFQKVRTVPNIVYERANGWEGKLDVYAQRAPAPTPTPTVIFIHGGGWVQG